MSVAAAMLHSQNTSCISGATIYIDTESVFSPHRLEPAIIIPLKLNFFMTIYRLEELYCNYFGA